MAAKKAPGDSKAPKKPAVPNTAAKKKSAAKPATARATAKVARGEFAEVFARLRGILVPYAPKMVVVKDDDTWYYLDTTITGPNKKPVMFAATRRGKAYVSFYLMCVYGNKKLMAEMSPELKKRMQGKSCFNFTAVDETVFRELAGLARAVAEWFHSGGLDRLREGDASCD